MFMQVISACEALPEKTVLNDSFEKGTSGIKKGIHT